VVHSVIFFQFCDVAEVAIIHELIEPKNLINGKKLNISFCYLLEPCKEI
jgi:hypothetical protein